MREDSYEISASDQGHFKFTPITYERYGHEIVIRQWAVSVFDSCIKPGTHNHYCDTDHRPHCSFNHRPFVIGGWAFWAFPRNRHDFERRYRVQETSAGIYELTV